ncbi:hypothetical protein BH10PSE12_BH10PSE12_02610 [soil metagenome]
MTEFHLRYDLATGAPTYPGSGPADGHAAQQQMTRDEAGEIVEGILVIPQDGWNGREVNFPAIAAFYGARIDTAAAVRQVALRDPARAAIDRAQLAEASGTAGALIKAEAEATGKTIAAVKQSILDAHAAWLIAAAQIESQRKAEKARLAAATSLPEIVAIVSAT